MPTYPPPSTNQPTNQPNRAQSEKPKPAGNQGIPSSIYRSLTKRDIQESNRKQEERRNFRCMYPWMWNVKQKWKKKSKENEDEEGNVWGH